MEPTNTYTTTADPAHTARRSDLQAYIVASALSEEYKASF